MQQPPRARFCVRFNQHLRDPTLPHANLQATQHHVIVAEKRAGLIELPGGIA